MQIAATTRSLWDMSFSGACGQLQDLGFDKSELWISDNGGQLTLSEVVSNPEAVVSTYRESSRLSPVAIFLDQEVSIAEFESIISLAKVLRSAQITIEASPLGTPFNSEIDRLRERTRLCMEEGIGLSILTKTGLLTEDPHTAIELCQSVKGLGITLDPSYYICTTKGPIDFDVVYPYVSHVHLRDTSAKDIQVPGGLGDVDYNRIIASLSNEGFNRTLSVDLLQNTMQGEDRLLEMRKLRLLLESLL